MPSWFRSIFTGSDNDDDNNNDAPYYDSSDDNKNGNGNESSPRRSRSFFLLGRGGGGSTIGGGSNSSSSQSIPPPPPLLSQRPILFCNLCDMRIATVLLNTMHIIFSLILELLELLRASYIEEPPILFILALIFSIMAIWGALNFNFIAMYCSTLGIFFIVFLYLSEVHVFGLLIVGCIFITQLIFIWEMRKGIMTKTNYKRAEYITTEGRTALQTAHIYAKEAAETTKEFVYEIKRQTSTTIMNAVKTTNSSNNKNNRNKNEYSSKQEPILEEC